VLSFRTGIGFTSVDGLISIVWLSVFGEVCARVAVAPVSAAIEALKTIAVLWARVKNSFFFFILRELILCLLCFYKVFGMPFFDIP